MEAFKEYAILAKAIEQSPEIPPCQTSDFEAWFPEPWQAKDYALRTARALCKTCPVQRECLTYALAANEAFGVWGGLDATERNNLRRTQKRHPKQRLAS